MKVFSLSEPIEPIELKTLLGGLLCEFFCVNKFRFHSVFPPPCPQTRHLCPKLPFIGDSRVFAPPLMISIMSSDIIIITIISIIYHEHHKHHIIS